MAFRGDRHILHRIEASVELVSRVGVQQYGPDNTPAKVVEMRFMKTRMVLLVAAVMVAPGCVRGPGAVVTVGLDCPDPGPAPEEKSPDTVAPSGDPPLVVGESYEAEHAPDVDPPGWKFGNRRSPEDSKDRKKKPFDIEANYKIADMGSPRWSPDGKTILFTAVERDFEKGKSDTDIYRVNADGTGLRRLTRNEGYDSTPRWAPDGKSFLFVSSRKEGSQLWRMPIDGGEPTSLTEISTGIDQPVWSPDGTKIAFASRVFPEHGADDAANKESADAMTDNPIQAHLADELLYRHWTFYNDGTRSHILVLDVESGDIVDVTPGDFESPVFAFGDPGLAFSPDSKEICFVSNRESPDAQSWTTNGDLWVVPASGGKAVNLTDDNEAFDGHPAYSPDGRYIAFLRQSQPGYEADLFALALYDRRSGTVKVLGGGFDDVVYAYQWASDSRTIVFQAPAKGRFPLFTADVDSGKVERVGHIPSVREFDLREDGMVAFTYHSVSDPVELFSAPVAGGEVTRLTELNRKIVEEYDMRPVEEMWVEGAGGKKVHVFLVKPHGFKKGKRYPAIINVHGGPQFQWSDSYRGNWQILPGAGYVVAFSNPHGSTGYGQDYTAAISKDWGGKVYEDVMAVTDAVAALDYVDEDRMGAMGWSYGGYMMGWLLGHTDRFKAIASMMGLYDLNSFYGGTEELWFPEWDVGKSPWDDPEAYRKWSPSTYAGNFKTPTLIITGERDYRVPYTQSLQMFTALKRQGVDARLVVFKNDGHWPDRVKSMPLYYAAHLDWFHRYLGGAPSPYDVEKMVRGTAFQKK